MKKLSILVFSILLLQFVNSSVFAQNKTDEQGRKQGHWIKTAKNGKKISEGNYKDNIPVDTFYYYDSKGKITIKNYFYNEGKNTHTWLMFANGKVQAEGEYANKQKQGTWVYYNEKGKCITEVDFKDNLKQGKEKIYDDEGKEILQITTYENGKRNGQFFKSLQSYGYYTTNYKDDVLEGDYKEYYPTKKIRQSGKYVNGNKEGIWTLYHNSGKIAQEFTYEKDELKQDVIIFSTSEGDKRINQTDISMVMSFKNKMRVFDMQGNKIDTNNDFEQMLQYLNGNRFMRIAEKDNLYMNVVTLLGINQDGSVKTDVDFSFKIMPDENGKQIIHSLTRED